MNQPVPTPVPIDDGLTAPILADLLARHPTLAGCAGDLVQASRLIAASFAAGNKFLICGNGGSAADAEHWSGELLKNFERRRPAPVDAEQDPHLRGRLEQGLPAIPLTGFTSLRTATANDREAVCEYAQLVTALGRPGDVLAGISTSGNAGNVGLAVRAANARGMTTIGLTGQGGGALKGLATLCIRVPSSRTADVQELHLAVYHAICRVLEAAFYPVAGPPPAARTQP